MSDELLTTGGPKTLSKTASTGIGQHTNQFLNRQTQPAHQQQQQQHQHTVIMPHYGGGAEKCARCSKSVYLAEKKTGAGRSFHSRCFSCQTCNRKLDATTISEHKGEIFCKTCYTRQFGVHGLISGVTMSTENPAREVRQSRRSSYGSDLDAPVITHDQTRQRAHSNDNHLRGEHGAIQHDELPKMFPWRNDILPEQEHRSPPSPSPSPNKTNIGLDQHIAISPHQKPASQIGFERVIGTTINKENIDHRQLSYIGENDRQKYIQQGEKLTYGNGTSALVDMPMVSPAKRVDSYVGRIDMPIVPTKSVDRSPSPSSSPSSTIPTDLYRRQSSRERQTDISDNFSRLTLNENHRDNLGRKPSNDMMTNMIALDNPLLKQMPSHASTYETNHFTVTSTTNNSNRETYRSRESSPSATAGNQRTSSSTSGYTSTSVHSDGNTRNSASPPSAYVPQHDYLNTQTSTSNVHVVDRHPPSPRPNERPASALNEFVSKTNHLSANPSPAAAAKYSTLAALIKPHRPISPQKYSDDDDQDFDN